jgi:hydroxymethylbilane synthase
MYPDTVFTLQTITTEGDKKRSAPVESLTNRGAFVKEIQEALLSNQVDMAVHSLKDLPVDELPGLTIAAICQRLDPRDVLVSRAGQLKELPPNSTVGTGSPRRTAQLLAYRPDLVVKNIRGNINTRIARVERGEFAAIVVAAAGLIRLGFAGRISEYLPLEYFLPEAGQAALAVEIRTDDTHIAEMVKPLNEAITACCVTAERHLLKTLGGGCSLVLGALGTIDGATLKLKGMLPGASRLIFAEEAGPASKPQMIAEKLAKKLLGQDATQPEKVQP